MRFIVLSIVLSGCANVHVNRLALATSTLALACDWGQTNKIASGGWGHGARETNPIMGDHPSVGHVGAYFVGVAAANVAMWVLMPARYRGVAPSAVIAVQTDAVYSNLTNGAGVCGL